jgi:hypothetical protein
MRQAAPSQGPVWLAFVLLAMVAAIVIAIRM